MHRASRGFSDTTSTRDAFSRVAEEIEKEARKLPDFSAGQAVSDDLLNKTSKR
jgi:hypothetical protein